MMRRTARRTVRSARRNAREVIERGRAYRAGANDAASLPTSDVPVAPPSPGRLERYFDSIQEGPGVWKWRHYFPIYERHLSRFVGTEFTLAEVGVYSGGSLRMWRDYFGQGCTVVGVDIEEACRVYADDGIEIMIGDQADPAFWAEFRRAVPRLDVLIDDGGHAPHQQIVTLREVLPHMQPGGVFLCEDIHGESHAFHTYVDRFTRPLHQVNLNDLDPRPIHQHVQSVHRYPILTVIEKPPSGVPRFDAPRHGTRWEPFLDHLLPSDREQEPDDPR